MRQVARIRKLRNASKFQLETLKLRKNIMWDVHRGEDNIKMI
jgi:hypothetical protein